MKYGIQTQLHPATLSLVTEFSMALAKKLHAAQEKYGFTDNWKNPDWMNQCRTQLLEHLEKGDPLDVAAYCAFLWYHGEGTSGVQAERMKRLAKLDALYKATKDLGQEL